MHGKLNALLEQQVRDGDELARELRKQVGESNAQIHVLRRALLRAGEVNSKLESSKLELSKSLGEAQDLVRGTRRLKEEGPVRWARIRIIIIRHVHIQCRSKHTHFHSEAGTYMHVRAGWDVVEHSARGEAEQCIA
jgi:hypothetical protein